MTTNNKPNKLAKEKSPYLLQHAYNPVDWFPWSEEAFEKAKQGNKPVFLSIGYSTCHWCHVMERESFEDDEVAEALNRGFVSIKVDREERPDIDNLYMAVTQAMTGQGGWPMTVVMTPDRKPFFAGTYFPKSRKYGRAGLLEILAQIEQKWRDDRATILDTGDRVVEFTQTNMLSNLQGEIGAKSLETAFTELEQMFDPVYGGFRSAPKFPTSHNLSFLLRYYKKSGNAKALEMVEKTLDAMHRGGMYDHIGFGFSRYSTDEQWLVPHFEKMLYDNALLAITYIEAFQVTGNRKYADIAEQILAYVLRDMTDKDGAFYSAEDADSEGEEGKFYVWTPAEVIRVLGEDDGELFCELYDITEQGNFEGASIPNLIGSTPEDFARRKQLPLDDLTGRLDVMRRKLFEHREKRIHPGKDDKVLTAWNGLMIAAMARAAKALDNRTYADAAERAARFILARMRREDGRLLVRYRDGEAAIPGYIDDYAFFIMGLTELYEATFRLDYLKEAVKLNEEAIRLFWDEDKGGFFFYGSDAEQLFTRPKEIYDGAMPSGNSAMALNLLRLSRFTYDARLSQLADEQLKAFAGAVERYPAGHSLFLAALDMAFGGGKEVVIAGDPASPDTQDMIRNVRRNYSPSAIVILHPDGEEGKAVGEMIPLVQDKRSLGGIATAYVCENFACQSPTSDPEDLLEL